MQRETKTLTTPAGKELILKSFLNARERNGIRSIYLEKMKISSEGVANSEGVDGTIVEKSEYKLIEVAVVSYDKKTTYLEILEALLEGNPEEYDYVIKETSRVNSGNLTSAK